MLERCDAWLFLNFLCTMEDAPFLKGWVSIFMGSESSCSDGTELECRNATVAFHLKLAAIFTILFTGAIGVSLPLLGRKLTIFKTDSSFFVVAKAFAAGVILATGFVHILPDAMEALTNDCLPEIPWRQFPFSGCIAMLAALFTLLVDIIGTEYYGKQYASEEQAKAATPAVVEWTEEPVLCNANGDAKGISVSGQTDADHTHIVGMHLDGASHRHSHPHGHHSCVDVTHDHAHEKFGNSHMSMPATEAVSTHVRHVVVSQVLELGILTHSVIIGVSLGVSQSPCTIRPLFAALSFHQLFEGFALGGCISQASFKSFSAAAMALCFTITTPLGIGVGTGIASGYDSNSRGALIVEGMFDSVSAGILIYMALVDLIAADFLGKHIVRNRMLQVLSYASLFFGAASMSGLAVWA